MTTSTAADDFIHRWRDRDGTEKSNFQLFLGELCELLGVGKPDPAHADNELNGYVFERRVDILSNDGSSRPGFIDLYKRGCFVLEGKQTGQKLESGRWDTSMKRAHAQADAYIRALPVSEGKPPFLLVTDVGRSLEIYAEFSRSGSVYTPFPDNNTFRIRLEDLRKPEVQERLRGIWNDPLSLDPAKRSAQVTRAIANQLAELAKSLEKFHAAETVGTFLMRCLFTMFAEDVGLLPKDGFTELLERLQEHPESFAPALQNLWTLMDKGGFDGVSLQTIRRFNGGLFADAQALPLSRGQIQMLYAAARSDWQFVEPAIFGTLLERALNPNERHKLGAHYTPRAYVERLVLPTVLEPLRQEWQIVQTAAVMYDQQGKHDKAIAEIRAFHARLCQLRILDPACGSGNFLYVTLEHMKRLEGEVLDTLQALGHVQGMLEMESVAVNPQQFLGLEVNPRAAAIAEMVLWIGYLQWHFRTHGNVAPAEPILRDFHNIENRDAVLAYDGVETVLDAAGNPVTRWDGRTLKLHPVTGKEVPDETAQLPVLRYLNPRKADWPAADYIIGNPPFIGNKRMRTVLGDGYVDALRTAWANVPESADFVMYWWHKAAEITRENKAHRFGLITTNSIRQIFNQKILQQHLEASPPLSLVFAVPDHPWVDSADGAAVRIAMTVGEHGNASGIVQNVISEQESQSDGMAVTLNKIEGKIYPNLKVGSNIAAAKALQSNLQTNWQGCKLVGDGFKVSPDFVEENNWLPKYANILHRYWTGSDVTKTLSEKWVIDFFGLTQGDALRNYPEPYQHLLDTVKPFRDQVQRKGHKEKWWIFGEARPGLRSALSGLSTYFVTSEVAKHRTFTALKWPDDLIDGSLIAISLGDWFHFGILSSRIHITWALSAGGTLENRPRYNNTRCFDPFPFPDASEEQKARIRDLAEQIDAHRKRQQAAYPSLTLTNLYNVLEKLRHEEPLNPKEKDIHQQGLVAILRELHDDLDRAVFNAYGWDDLAAQLVGKPGATTPLPDKPEAQAQAEEALLSRLVDLNAQRAAEEAQGHIRWLRPDFQSPDTATPTQPATDTSPDEAEEETTAASVSADKLNWPKGFPEQIKVVRELLQLAPQTAEGLADRFKRKPVKGVLPVVDALVGLGMVVCEGGVFRVV
jgi:hypothetical protein